MKRAVVKELIKWKEDPEKVPLIVRGARQVGKTWLICEFGREHFDEVVVADFEKMPELSNSFHVLDPRMILERLEFYLKMSITPGKTLLFLDEIQLCPRAITGLRYFKEEMRDLHVIAAGSLLEFALNGDPFSFPVGRVGFLFMRPLSYMEFLDALHEEAVVSLLHSISLSNPIELKTHVDLLSWVREYFCVGGMPEVVATYKKQGLLSDCQPIQNRQITAYIQDFGKYGKKANQDHLRQLFNKIPECITRSFKYNRIDPDSTNPSREYKHALIQLEHAGLINQVFDTRANGIPLQSQVNEKKFKTFFLDVGLMQRILQVDLEDYSRQTLLDIHRGALAEQFVGQELLAYSPYDINRKLYYWETSHRGGAAEIDYVTTFDSQIVPIEVKAGMTGRLKSLKQFMEKKKIPLGIRISERPLSLEHNVLSVPFYLVSQLPRLITEASYNIS